MPTPVVLELALNGGTPRSRNRHVPRTPAEIAEGALEGIGVERRWAHVEELARRGMGGMTLVDPGSVNVGPGEPGNADLLRAAVALVERLGRAPATIAETRALLGVPDRPGR